MISEQKNDNIGECPVPIEPLQRHVMTYIESVIDGFPRWLSNSNIDTQANENVLNAKLSAYLTHNDEEGYLTYKIAYTNQPNDGHKDVPDIGVSAGNKKATTQYFFYIECKRLPTPKGPKRKENEYVSNGIQRFKENKHAPKLLQSAMVGYVQKNNFKYWYEQVNGWIDTLTKEQPAFWSESEKLQQLKSENYNRFFSKHKRKNGEDITLHHYWINLVS